MQCKSLLETVESDRRREGEENGGVAQGGRDNGAGRGGTVVKPLRFDSLISARDYFTEQKIAEVDADEQTAALIRQECQ